MKLFLCSVFAAVALMFIGDQTEAVCVCPMNLVPVCGMDGVTYANPCELVCREAKLAYNGVCKDDGTQSNVLPNNN